MPSNASLPFNYLSVYMSSFVLITHTSTVCVINTKSYLWRSRLIRSGCGLTIGSINCHNCSLISKMGTQKLSSQVIQMKIQDLDFREPPGIYLVVTTFLGDIFVWLCMTKHSWESSQRVITWRNYYVVSFIVSFFRKPQNQVHLWTWRYTVDWPLIPDTLIFPNPTKCTNNNNHHPCTTLMPHNSNHRFYK